VAQLKHGNFSNSILRFFVAGAIADFVVLTFG
jgi:hypothetical protein